MAENGRIERSFRYGSNDSAFRDFAYSDRYYAIDRRGLVWLSRHQSCNHSGLGFAFAVSFAIGRLRRWGLAGQTQVFNYALNALFTLLVQMCLVGILFLIGRGVASVMGADAALGPLSLLDNAYALGLGAVGAGMGLIITAIEKPVDGLDRAKHAVSELGDAAPIKETPELVIDPTPLALDSFFIRDIEQPAPATDEQIAAAEARLGVVLPDMLKALYRQHNGGYLDWMFVPKVPQPRPMFEDWKGAFSIDYCDLIPLEKLRTLWDAYSDFLDPDDEEDGSEVPDGAKNIILLSQRYMDCTVLDYNAGTPPKAGFVDYDRANDRVMFEDFEAMFAALRRSLDD